METIINIENIYDNELSQINALNAIPIYTPFNFMPRLSKFWCLVGGKVRDENILEIKEHSCMIERRISTRVSSWIMARLGTIFQWIHNDVIGIVPSPSSRFQLILLFQESPYLYSFKDPWFMILFQYANIIEHLKKFSRLQISRFTKKIPSNDLPKSRKILIVLVSACIWLL